MLRGIFLLSLALALTMPIHLREAQAGPVCDYYRKNDPYLYKVVSTNGSASTKPAGASSTFTSSFNLNSASLPSEPSSYGLETLGSFLLNPIPDQETSTWTPTFSLIKGFHKFGTGISTSSNNTFYGNDLLQRLYSTPEVQTFTPLEKQTGKLINLNLGTSVLLLDPSRGPKVQLGLTVRYNKTSATWGGGPGIMLVWNHFSLGGGFTREKISNFIDRTTFTSLLFSARVSIFEFEYTRLNTLGDQVQLQGLSPIQIFTATALVKKLTLSAAIRHLNYVNFGYVNQPYYAAQYMFSKYFTGGFLVNYIPGTFSLGTQFFL